MFIKNYGFFCSSNPRRRVISTRSSGSDGVADANKCRRIPDDPAAYSFPSIPSEYCFQNIKVHHENDCSPNDC